MSDSTTIAVNCRCNPAEIEGWSYVQWIGTYFGDCVRSPLERMSFGMGLLSLMLFLVATFPQMRKNYIRKRVDGLSFGLLGTWALGDLSNYFGTIFTGQLATQRLTAFYFLGTDIIMLWQYVYYRFYYQRFGFVVPKLNAGAEEEDEDDDQEEAASNERRPLLQSINNYNNISISTSYSSAIPDEEEVFLSGSAASASAGNIAITDDSPPPLTRAYLLVLLFQFLLSWVLLFTMEYVAGILIYHIGGDTTGNDREFCDTTEPLPAWLVIAGSMMAWISGTLYFTSRIPQILVNHQTKSVEALSLVGWIIIILGNAFYGLSILFRLPNASDAKFYQSTLPYIIGSAGTITFDFVILFQAYLYGVLTMKSFPILDIPLDLILKYLSPFLSLPDFISFHRRTCKGLLVGQELSECRDFHKMWVKAIRGNKPSILCNIVRLSTIHSASNWPGPELGDVNAASWESENLHTISWAVAKDHVDLVRVLLADGRSNPARNDNFAIRWTTHPEIARLLLVDPRVNPAAGNNDAIRRACADGRHLVVEVLLSDHRVDPAAEDSQALRFAASHGHHEVVRLLLSLDHSRINPVVDDNYAIKWSAYNGHHQVVSLLLADPRVDPTAGNNFAVRLAASNGQTIVLGLLLADPRVDPTADDHYAIRKAGQYGRLDAVCILLADGRVDPASGDNHAVVFATLGNHYDVVKALLKDGRVDPSAQSHKAIIVAARNGYQRVVELLLKEYYWPTRQDQELILLSQREKENGYLLLYDLIRISK